MTEVIDISKNFKESSVAEFFQKNRQMLGYSGAIKSLTTAVHEYVTNSLDAAEEHGILPDIFVQIERMGPDFYKLIVEDNGPGIPKKFVGKAYATMLAGTKFHRFVQQRGQQGIGGTGVVMFGQITTGQPTKVITSDGKGMMYECKVSIDIQSNKEKIIDEREYPGQMRGVRAETHLKTVKYQTGDKSPDEYLRRTALANPHCKITYIDPEGQTTIYDRSINVLPKKPKETKPHPKGIEVHNLLAMITNTKARTIKSFLSSEFTRMSTAKAEEIAKKVSFDMNKRPQAMRWEEAEEIVKAIQDTSFIAPPTDCLIPIGEDQLRKALHNIIQPEFEATLTRNPALYRGGVPFIIEVAVTYGGKSGKHNGNGEEKIQEGDNIELMRFSNRVPLLFDAGGCVISKAVESIEWRRYGIKAENPVTVLVNFTSIHVPYTSAGKESIAEEEEILKEVKLALMDSGRKVGAYVSGQVKKFDREKRKKMFEKYIPETAKAISELSGENEAKLKKKLEAIIDEKYKSGELEKESENDALDAPVGRKTLVEE